jgi:hypothetical protein
MSKASLVFDGINKMKKNSKELSTEDFDFFITTGDNLYPIDEYNPTEKEFETMMSMFTER